MKTTCKSVQYTVRFLLILLGMGIIISCMPDDGQFRKDSIMTQLTLERTSRRSSIIPVNSAQSMPASRRDNPPIRNVYVVRDVDFKSMLKFVST